jgi:serine/threonine protein kinase
MLKDGMFIGERYEVMNKIGSGGMADVYKAKDLKLNRFVAIKVLKPEFREDKTFVSKFRAEAQSAAGLTHPNIVSVYDVGDEGGIHFIVMELVEGITLKDYIVKKGRLSVKEATSIAIQVSMGLEAAHNNHIVHRDIKPQNIIISTDGKVKVTDFGIARAASSNTISSNVMGSVHYSSPEQARGGYSDEKSDIYSLGITMYEMVTGRVPFDGDTTVAIAIKHLQEEIEAPSRYAPELPYSMEQIILKCTQKSADRRYNNIVELIQDLKQSLVNPDGDFVQLIPLNNHAKTVMITREELEQINNEKRRNTYQDEEDEEDEYEEDDDEENDYEDDEDNEDEYEDDEDSEDEEEDEDGINPKLEKALTIGGIIVAVLIAGIFIALIGNTMGIFKFSPSKKDKTTESVTESSTKESSKESGTEENNEKVEVPDLRNMTLKQAEELLGKLQLGIKEDSSSPKASSDYEKNTIMEQDVAAGTKVAKHTKIKVVLSSGAKKVTVPDVRGKTQAAAETELKGLGLKTNVVQEYNDDYEIGIVISTDPGSESQVDAGALITVKVSRGREIIESVVPNVVGKSESAAKSLLDQNNLNYDTETQLSDSVESGKVISQSVAAGKKVEQGTTIHLVISSGAPDPAETAIWGGEVNITVPNDYNGGILRAHVKQGSIDSYLQEVSNLGVGDSYSGFFNQGAAGEGSATVQLEEMDESGAYRPIGGSVTISCSQVN